LTTGFTRADAIASLIVVGLMLKSRLGVATRPGRVLLEAGPKSTDLDDIRAHLLATDHVHEVHDLHAWTVTSSLPALSAHVVIDESDVPEGSSGLPCARWRCRSTV
jgi:cobalt-zinc-cadmium efflux system protein